MKVHIGKYPGNYTIGGFTSWLERIGIPEKYTDKIFDYLKDTWVEQIAVKFSFSRKQKVSIKIDKWDTWNMDYTLSLIIVPMLKQLKETKNGAPCVDDEDVPEELRSTSAPPHKEEWDLDENWFKRWDWVLDEMIWAFEQKSSDDNESQFFDHSKVNENAEFETQMNQIICDWDGLSKHQERIRNGIRLFGKHYQNLWD